MKDNFEKAMEDILSFEGGYSDHPMDKGGPTNYGITLKTYTAWWRIKPGPKPPCEEYNPTKKDLINIKKEEVLSIYREMYADKIYFDRLPSGIDFALLDFAVNSGPVNAVKCLQEVLGVYKDGFIGPKTLAAITAPGVDILNLITALCERRRTFVRSLKSYRTFGRGWETRINFVAAAARRLRSDIKEDTSLPKVVTPQKAAGDVKKPISERVKEGAVVVGGLGATLLTGADQIKPFLGTSAWIKVAFVTLLLAGAVLTLIGTKFKREAL